MKKVLAIDLGFGSTKICYRTNENVLRWKKFISSISKVSHSDTVNDQNAFEFNGQWYYLFDAALKLPNSNLIDLMSYEGLRESSPIIIRYLIDKFKFEFDTIVLGLSIAFVQFSKDYKNYIAANLHIPVESIKLVPQGIGSKIAYDSFNLNPEDNTNYSGNRCKNFLGVDIGFNTVDIYQVINGECSGNAVQGFEGKGLRIVAQNVIEYIKKENGVDVTIQDVKGIMEAGIMNFRGATTELSNFIDYTIAEYIKILIQLIEKEFGKSIDKMDHILFIGGGAALIKKYQTAVYEEIHKHYKGDFVVIPSLPEFYNVLGYYLAGANEK